MESKLVPGICTQCQSVINLDPNQDAAICPSCGTPFIVEKAINHYNISSQGALNISNSVLNLGPSAANLTKRGLHFMELNEFEKAEEYFNKALDIDADYQEAYTGLIKLQALAKERETQVLLERAKNEESLCHFRKALRIYEELCKRNPNNESFRTSRDRAQEYAQRYAYVCVSAEQMGPVFPVPGTLYFSAQGLAFVPRDDSRKQIFVYLEELNEVYAFRSGVNNSGKLNLLRFSYGKGEYKKDFFFRTDNANEIAKRINSYLKNGFD